MNKENTEKLYKDFPELYKQHTLSMQQTCMCWNFECGDGWFDLIYNLSKALTKLDIGIEAVQVKEKYGGLRFYVNGGNVDTDKLISEAEALSYEICEVCGKKGKPNEDGWISTLCKKCRKNDK